MVPKRVPHLGEDEVSFAPEPGVQASGGRAIGVAVAERLRRLAEGVRRVRSGGSRTALSP